MPIKVQIKKKLDSFAQAVPDFYLPEDTLPRYYREALVMYYVQRNDTVSSRADSLTLDRFKAYQTLQQKEGSPLEERNRRNQEELLKEQQKQRERENTTIDYVFNVGERVFHEKLGVGHIIDVITIGESMMYTIDFGKMGKKAMDAAYAKLKKF